MSTKRKRRWVLVASWEEGGREYRQWIPWAASRGFGYPDMEALVIQVRDRHFPGKAIFSPMDRAAVPVRTITVFKGYFTDSEFQGRAGSSFFEWGIAL